MTSYTAVYADGTKEHVRIEAMLGQGGEGGVYTIVGKSDVVAKIYHPKYQTRDRYEKLRVMISNPPEDKMRAVYGHVSIAWPMGLLIAGGKFVGYLMPRIRQGSKILNVFNPARRRQNYPRFTWRHLHHVGANLAVAMHALHVRGYVVGDVNADNILVTREALVTLVDTDSFQVRDHRTGRVYRCGVGKPEYTPPELQGVSFQTVDRTKYHDYFGLAVLIFQLLMEGLHPFTGVPRTSMSVAMPLLQHNIKNGIFPYVPNRQCTPPKAALPFAALVPEVRQLFVHAFVDGHRDPRERPSAFEWYVVLTQAQSKLVQCSRGHWYANHLQRCPWCERELQWIPKQPLQIPKQRSQISRPRAPKSWLRKIFFMASTLVTSALLYGMLGGFLGEFFGGMIGAHVNLSIAMIAGGIFGVAMSVRYNFLSVSKYNVKEYISSVWAPTIAILHIMRVLIGASLDIAEFLALSASCFIVALPYVVGFMIWLLLIIALAIEILSELL